MTIPKIAARLHFVALCLLCVMPVAHAAEIYQIGRQKIDLAVPPDYVNMASLSPKYKNFLSAITPAGFDLLLSYAHQSDVPDIMARSPDIPIPRWTLGTSVISEVDSKYGKQSIDLDIIFQAIKLAIMLDNGKLTYKAKREAEFRISNALSTVFHSNNPGKRVNADIVEQTLVREFTQTDTQMSWVTVEKREITGTGFSEIDAMLSADTVKYKAIIWANDLAIQTEVSAIYYSDADLKWVETAGAAWTQRILASNR